MTYDKLFYQALRIRRAEEKIIELYPSDKIQSPVHLSIGQEHVASGICAALKKTDWVFGSYRSHAFFLAKGGDMKLFFAELYGKKTGEAQGKAGSMHLFAKDVGFMGASAVVASTIPHAVGAAYARKNLKLDSVPKDQVIVAVFGDGATEAGVYHESLNFAAIHKLPILFICENNGLAVHSRPEIRQSYRIAEHARGYGLETQTIENSQDMVGLAEKTLQCVSAIRSGSGPVFMEVKTSRYMEHVGIGEDFHATYRTRDEVDVWMKNDPLSNDAALIKRFNPEIDAEIAEAIKFAEESPWPGVEDLLADVY